MSSVIPLEPLAEYKIKIELGSIVCDIRFYWTEYSSAIKANFTTNGFWAMDIKNNLFDIKAVRLVGGSDLMWPYSLPFGGFVLFDIEGRNEDPDFDGIGSRWQLNYYPITEVQQLREDLRLETI